MMAEVTMAKVSWNMAKVWVVMGADAPPTMGVHREAVLVLPGTLLGEIRSRGAYMLLPMMPSGLRLGAKDREKPIRLQRTVTMPCVPRASIMVVTTLFSLDSPP